MRAAYTSINVQTGCRDGAGEQDGHVEGLRGGAADTFRVPVVGDRIDVQRVSDTYCVRDLTDPVFFFHTSARIRPTEGGVPDKRNLGR
jgi:hypothetical protein